VSRRADIRDALAASQTQVIAFFRGLGTEGLERPATASGFPGAAPWRAKDHLAHLANSERAIQRLLRRSLAGDTRDVLLRLQYPPGMPIPDKLGDLSALTPEETERLVTAVAEINQAYVDAHHHDSLEMLTASYVGVRQGTLDLLQRFSDDQLAGLVPTVVDDRPASELFAGRAEHAAQHIAWILEGSLQGE
jgi:hypothetical protein